MCGFLKRRECEWAAAGLSKGTIVTVLHLGRVLQSELQSRRHNAAGSPGNLPDPAMIVQRDFAPGPDPLDESTLDRSGVADQGTSIAPRYMTDADEIRAGPSQAMEIRQP